MNRSETPADDGRRFTLLTEATMTARQREAHQGIVSGPRKGAVGPFNALLRSPDVADRVQRVGEYVRFQTTIPAPLNELAILITGRFWNAQFEFWAHSRLARTAGLPDAIIDAVAEGRRPSPMSDNSRSYDFCSQMLHDIDPLRHSIQGPSSTTRRAGHHRPDHRIRCSSMVWIVLNINRSPLPSRQAASRCEALLIRGPRRRRPL